MDRNNSPDYFVTESYRMALHVSQLVRAGNLGLYGTDQFYQSANVALALWQKSVLERIELIEQKVPQEIRKFVRVSAPSIPGEEEIFRMWWPALPIGGS